MQKGSILHSWCNYEQANYGLKTCMKNEAQAFPHKRLENYTCSSKQISWYVFEMSKTPGMAGYATGLFRLEGEFCSGIINRQSVSNRPQSLLENTKSNNSQAGSIRKR